MHCTSFRVQIWHHTWVSDFNRSKHIPHFTQQANDSIQIALCYVDNAPPINHRWNWGRFISGKIFRRRKQLSQESLFDEVFEDLAQTGESLAEVCFGPASDFTAMVRPVWPSLSQSRSRSGSPVSVAISLFCMCLVCVLVCLYCITHDMKQSPDTWRIPRVKTMPPSRFHPLSIRGNLGKMFCALQVT